jgi:pimeloyl-ACP methyl ester carboxylesterase
VTNSAIDKHVVVNGLRMHYRDWGGDGDLLVLLHGLASNCRFWDLAAPLLTRNFTVLALDQRGHGSTDKPVDGYDFPTVADDLLGFLQAIGADRPLIVGHSWGGNVALELAARHPSVPRALCLVDGGLIELSAVPEMSLEKARVDLAPPDMTHLTMEQLFEMAKNHLPDGRGSVPEIKDFLLANFDVVEDGTIRPKLTRENHMRIIDAMWDHKPSRSMGLVNCPVLLMPARQDGDDAVAERRFGREQAVERASRLLPVSRTVWLEDSVHDVPIQRPELVASVIAEQAQNGFLG